MTTKTLAEYVATARDLAPLIREHAEQSEREARLAPQVVDALHDSGLMRILLPARLGGGDLTIPESVRVFEEVARADGSTGWVYAICSGGPLFGHFVSADAFEQIFTDPRVAVAGSLNPMTCSAVPVDGGYRYSGKATFVSGCRMASWIAVSGVVLRDGQPTFTDGMPLVRSALFPMSQCRILDTWSVSGMCGTGSNDCVFEDVFVPQEFTYAWPYPTTTWRHGAYASVPLPTQLGGALAAVALGVARHCIEAFVELAVAKVPTATRTTLRERPIAQIQYAQAEGLLEAGAAYLHCMLDEVWQRGESGAPFDATARAKARLASVTAARLAAQAVDLIHDAAGATSIQTSCAIERCWRDVHAVTQHIILSTARFEIVGRVLLGLDAGTPII